MKFEDLVKVTLYKPTTLARAVLYSIGSDRLKAQISNIGYEIDPAERSQIIQIAAGNKEIRARFETKPPVKPEPESKQLDIIDSSDSNTNTEGQAA